jgi:signal transduction histidine kinase
VFNEMTARLDESFQRIREFTLHASHELKTPLTVMQAEIETACRDEAVSQAQRDVLLDQLDEIQRLAKKPRRRVPGPLQRRDAGPRLPRVATADRIGMAGRRGRRQVGTVRGRDRLHAGGAVPVVTFRPIQSRSCDIRWDCAKSRAGGSTNWA